MYTCILENYQMTITIYSSFLEFFAAWNRHGKLFLIFSSALLKFFDFFHLDGDQ
jgi:hypothetical protein